ncbi:transmembrane 6 superfamily member 2 isoform X4 [Neofelis nebulosa]|uniref:transmembrane 6 superfamily member 2 isoform X4 n=1 Tax=Neofelis nebulosa TaxID=61452 RepID=UPI002729C8E4|nr:transmembrane 6 superfamily member 2 isoform X4 [Neofelis nebulosa]
MQGQVAGQLDQTPLVQQGISPARTLGREDAPLQKRRAPRRPRRGRAGVQAPLLWTSRRLPASSPLCRSAPSPCPMRSTTSRRSRSKYSSEIRPAFFLAIPYMLVPCWAGMKVFSQSRAPTSCIPHMVQEEQRKGLLRRPVDLVLVIYLTLAGFFTLFRGLVVLDCPTDACFIYIYQYEPYLRDPVAYPKVQMLVYMFYVLPFYGLAVYALIVPGCSWLPDWALVFAGAVGQAPDIHPPCVATRHSSRTWVPPCTCARPSPTVCLMTPGPASSGATCCMRWAPTCWPSAAFSGPPSSCALPLAPRPTTRSSTERAGDSPGLCLHA